MGASKEKRQREIVNALLDVMESVAADMKSGLSFEEALNAWVKASDNELSHAFDSFFQEVQQGEMIPGRRRDALAELSRRINVPKVTTFVDAILQADKQGVSILETINTLSGQMRRDGRQAE